LPRQQPRSASGRQGTDVSSRRASHLAARTGRHARWRSAQRVSQRSSRSHCLVGSPRCSAGHEGSCLRRHSQGCRPAVRCTRQRGHDGYGRGALHQPALAYSPLWWRLLQRWPMPTRPSLVESFGACPDADDEERCQADDDDRQKGVEVHLLSFFQGISAAGVSASTR
jgi:hypothetical protein